MGLGLVRPVGAIEHQAEGGAGKEANVVHVLTGQLQGLPRGELRLVELVVPPLDPPTIGQSSALQPPVTELPGVREHPIEVSDRAAEVAGGEPQQASLLEDLHGLLERLDA